MVFCHNWILKLICNAIHAKRVRLNNNKKLKKNKKQKKQKTKSEKQKTTKHKRKAFWFAGEKSRIYNVSKRKRKTQLNINETFSCVKGIVISNKFDVDAKWRI